MTEREPNLVTSGLSRCVTEDGVTVAVGIFRLDHETTWTLEVVNPEGTSTVWDEQFPTDDAAYEEFARTVNERSKLTRFQHLNLTHPLWRKGPRRAALI